jgi:hypothetical protein
MLLDKVLLAGKRGDDKWRQQRYNVNGMAVTTPASHPQAAHQALAQCAVLFSFRQAGVAGAAQRTVWRD